MDECNASPIVFSISSLVSFNFSPTGQNMALQAPGPQGATSMAVRVEARATHEGQLMRRDPCTAT
jgi:hypothetical protein